MPSVIRSMWLEPRRLEGRSMDRHVAFLELFYDLVYVVVIAQLSHTFAHNLTFEGLKEFAFLFTMVWWAWINGTTYHDLHGNDDLRTRVFTFLQMFAVVAMAVYAHDALGEGSIGFALAFTFFILVMTVLWWSTGVADPAHRPLSTPYVIGFLLIAGLFIASTKIEPPLRFYLWGLAVLTSLLLPWFALGRAPSDAETRAQIERAMTVSPSLVERFGLFTIIVLGEVVVAIVAGMSELHRTDLALMLPTAMGTLVAVGIWWVYFDSISHRPPIKGALRTMGWYYIHLPLTMGIAAVGAGLTYLLAHIDSTPSTSVRWLLTGSLAVVLLCIATLVHNVERHGDYWPAHLAASIAMIGSAVLLVVVAMVPLATIPLLGVLLLLLFWPTIVGFTAWIRSQPASSSST